MAKKSGLTTKLYSFTEELEAMADEVKLEMKKEFDAKAKKDFNQGFVTRPNATKLIWLYIKKFDLQNPANRREILADDILKDFAGVKKFSMMQLAKFLSNHLTAK